MKQNLVKLAFHPLGNFGHVVVSGFHFLSFQSSKSKGDAPFHYTACDYSCTEWDSVCNHLRDVPWEDIFKLGGCAATTEFSWWIQVGINVYIPYCK